MRFAVLIKQVPDTYDPRALDPDTGLADRTSGDQISDEVSGRALEVALAHRDRHDAGEIIAITMGPAQAESVLRNALAMGADRAIHVLDDALVGADMRLTAEVLSAVVAELDVDIVLGGAASTDGASGAIPVMLAETLRWPALTNLSAVEIAGGVAGTRITESATVELSASTPAVLSVTDALPEARYPGFKGIMSAKKKPIDVRTAASLGVDPDSESRGASVLIEVAKRPARTAGTKIVDDGAAAGQLARYLVDAGLV